MHLLIVTFFGVLSISNEGLSAPVACLWTAIAVWPFIRSMRQSLGILREIVQMR